MPTERYPGMMEAGFHLLLPDDGASGLRDGLVLPWDGSHTTGTKGQGTRRWGARPPPDDGAESCTDVCAVFSPRQGLEHDVRRSQRELTVHGDLGSWCLHTPCLFIA